MTKVWITKYALSSGIFSVEAEIDGTMVGYCRTGRYHEYAHRQDWHRSEQDALVRARAMRDAKIKSLKKQITRLEKMTFPDPPQ